MSTKDDSILYGAKRAGVTYLYEFDTRSQLENAQAAAKRLGINLGQLLHGKHKQPQPRTFTEADQESATLKVQITECDPFTRAALERQAKHEGVSIEQYIAEAAFGMLECCEQEYWSS